METLTIISIEVNGLIKAELRVLDNGFDTKAEAMAAFLL